MVTIYLPHSEEAPLVFDKYNADNKLLVPSIESLKLTSISRGVWLPSKKKLILINKMLLNTNFKCQYELI